MDRAKAKKREGPVPSACRLPGASPLPQTPPGHFLKDFPLGLQVEEGCVCPRAEVRKIDPKSIQNLKNFEVLKCSQKGQGSVSMVFRVRLESIRRGLCLIVEQSCLVV